MKQLKYVAQGSEEHELIFHILLGVYCKVRAIPHHQRKDENLSACWNGSKKTQRSSRYIVAGGDIDDDNNELEITPRACSPSKQLPTVLTKKETNQEYHNQRCSKDPSYEIERRRVGRDTPKRIENLRQKVYDRKEQVRPIIHTHSPRYSPTHRSSSPDGINVTNSGVRHVPSRIGTYMLQSSRDRWGNTSTCKVHAPNSLSRGSDVHVITHARPGNYLTEEALKRREGKKWKALKITLPTNNHRLKLHTPRARLIHMHRQQFPVEYPQMDKWICRLCRHEMKSIFVSYRSLLTNVLEGWPTMNAIMDITLGKSWKMKSWRPRKGSQIIPFLCPSKRLEVIRRKTK